MKKKSLFHGVVLFVIMLLTCTCDIYNENIYDELSIKRTPYTGNELRIDGYYYEQYFEVNISICFLYRDGTYLYGSACNVNELQDLEERYRSGNYYQFSKDDRIGWGVFKIDGKNIRYEKWHSRRNGVSPTPAFIHYGEILNDTTFHISRITRSDSSTETLTDETYHFKQFSPKPDSTNGFVK